jgi:hypothetical protein
LDTGRLCSEREVRNIGAFAAADVCLGLLFALSTRLFVSLALRYPLGRLLMLSSEALPSDFSVTLDALSRLCCFLSLVLEVDCCCFAVAMLFVEATCFSVSIACLLSVVGKTSLGDRMLCSYALGFYGCFLWPWFPLDFLLRAPATSLLPY